MRRVWRAVATPRDARATGAILRPSVSGCRLPASAPGPTRVAAAMATRQGAVTPLRCGLLGDAPGRAGRRSCHRARGTRTPGRCAPGSAPLGQRLRSRRETQRAPWGARPERPRPWPHGGRSRAAAAECARVQAPGGPWTPVQESAERAVVLLTSPHLTRADHRRRQREERKRAKRLGWSPRPGMAR